MSWQIIEAHERSHPKDPVDKWGRLKKRKKKRRRRKKRRTVKGISIGGYNKK